MFLRVFLFFRYKLTAFFSSCPLKLVSCVLWLSFLPYLNNDLFTILLEILTFSYYECLFCFILFLIDLHLLIYFFLKDLQCFFELLVFCFSLIVLNPILFATIKVLLSKIFMSLLLFLTLFFQFINNISLIA